MTDFHKCPLCKSGTAIYFGKGNYRCVHNRMCGRVFQAKEENGILVLLHPEPTKEVKDKKTHVDIKCADCGNTRTVKVQDAFQVKRCKDCQHAHRRKSRKASSSR